MNINLKAVRFSIKKLGNDFGIVVVYDNATFTIKRGELAQVKKDFIEIVKDRVLLVPYIEYYLKEYAIA